MGTTQEKVKFYRGKSYDPTTQGDTRSKGEIVFLNDAFDSTLSPGTPAYEDAVKFGSIYQDDKIVGTTRAEQLMTTAPITVQGGPLANNIAESGETWPFGTDTAGNKVIPAGTSIQDILTQLFLKEKWGAPEEPVVATLTTSVEAPTPILNADSKTDSLVEIGDTITVSKITANSVTYGGTETTSVSGFTYGYSIADDNTKDSSNTSVSASRNTPVPNSGETYSMTVTNNFGATVQTIPTDATASNVICKSSTNANIAFTGTAMKGSNTVSVSETGVGSTAIVDALPSYYACSNVGNTHKSDGSTIKSKSVAENTLSIGKPSDTSEASLTGVFAIYSTGTLYTGGWTTSETSKDSGAWSGQSGYMKFSSTENPQRLLLTDLTNGTSAFYGYIGFGKDTNPETLKIIYLPEGWKISSVVKVPDSTAPGVWLPMGEGGANKISQTVDGVNTYEYDFENNSGYTSKYTKWQITGVVAAQVFKLKIEPDDVVTQ